MDFEAFKKTHGLPDVRVFESPWITYTMWRYLEPHRKVIGRMLDVFPEPLYLFGGPSRDVLRFMLEAAPLCPPSDLDFFIDDSESPMSLATMLERLERTELGKAEVVPFLKTGYGRVHTSDILCEILPFSSKVIYVEHPEIPVSLEPTLTAIDLNLSSSCFDLRNPRIVSCGVAEGIQAKEVEVAYAHPDGVDSTMARLILHSRRFNYTLGPKARLTIRREYRPDRDRAIRAYLKDKKVDVDSVIGALRALGEPCSTGSKSPG